MKVLYFYELLFIGKHLIVLNDLGAFAIWSGLEKALNLSVLGCGLPDTFSSFHKLTYGF